MVRPLELVLDENEMAVCCIATKNVGSERTDALLLGLDLELDADGFAKEDDVLRLRQPWREVAWFTDPGFSQLDFSQPAEHGLWFIHRSTPLLPIGDLPG